MASVDKRPNGKYLARWREYPNGPQKTRMFDKKGDADRFLVKVQHDLLTGRYVDPRAGMRTVGDYAAEWVTRQNWKPSTHERAERVLRLYILPIFGNRPLAAVKAPQLDTWIRSLGLAPATARSIATTFGALLTSAVKDDLLAVSPMSKATLPKVEFPPLVPLAVEEVHRLAECAPGFLRAAIVMGAGTGLRQGEAMAVTADRALPSTRATGRSAIGVVGPQANRVRAPKVKARLPNDRSRLHRRRRLVGPHRHARPRPRGSPLPSQR